MAAGLCASTAAAKQQSDSNNRPAPVRVSAEQLFAVADQARAARDFATAEAAYRALATNPDVEDPRAAERELRSAQTAGLPPEVEQQIRFYAAALSAQKPFVGSVAIAFAPNSNINRATRSDNDGSETVIGGVAYGKRN